jgi:hypothetical protein
MYLPTLRRRTVPIRAICLFLVGAGCAFQRSRDQADTTACRGIVDPTVHFTCDQIAAASRAGPGRGMRQARTPTRDLGHIEGPNLGRLPRWLDD